MRARELVHVILNTQKIQLHIVTGNVVQEPIPTLPLTYEKSGLRVFSLETLKSVADLSGLGQVYEVSNRIAGRSDRPHSFILACATGPINEGIFNVDKLITGNGIEIRTESFGNKNDEPLLLIMGAGGAGVYWQDNLIQRLLDAGRFVVRYDNRDTGKSTCFDFTKEPYSLEDMAADAIAVLDAYGIERADIAGASMGGMISQVLMINHPHRLKTATLIMSSPLSGGGETPTLGSDDLPGPDPAWMEKMIQLAMNIPEDRDAAIEQKVVQFGMLAGSAEPYDAEAVRKIAAIEFDQARNLAASANHSLAIGATTLSDRRPLLRNTNVPTLVIHGTEDPILPYPHGVALAQTIPGAELLTLDKGGHDMPECYLDEMISKMQVLWA